MPVQVELKFWQRVGAAEEAESYQVGIERAPGRGWGGPLQAGGLDEGHAIAIRRLYAAYLQRQQRGASRPASAADLEPLRAAGNQLFASLPETVQVRLHQALAVARRQGEALEIVLTFEPSAQALLSLPWELLHSPEGRFFFGLQGSLTRRLALPAAPAGVELATRATLGVWAEPRGMPSLAERRAAGPAPGGAQTGAGIVWLEGRDTLKRMNAALEEGDFDALHVVAHGRGDEAYLDFALALEDNEGAAQWLSSEQLATFISGFGRLRFVYLDVCAAGQSGDDGYAPGGLAVALLQAGIPAVLVMQEDMAQGAAGLLAAPFYAARAQGQPMSAALSAGRRAVRVALDDPVHWSVAALYTQEQPASLVEGLAVVDAFLDSFGPQHVWHIAGGALLITLLAHLSYRLAMTPAGETRAVALLLMQSAALPVLGALLCRGGMTRLRATYGLGRRAEVGVVRDQLFSAAVWAAMGWLLVLAALLTVTMGGLWSRLGLDGRQILWVVLLGFVTLAGYIGARQSMRQSFLFLKESRPPRGWWELPVIAAILFVPLLCYLLAQWLGAGGFD